MKSYSTRSLVCNDVVRNVSYDAMYFADVPIRASLHIKRLLAQCASVRPFSSVDSHVLCQITLAVAHLAAQSTLPLGMRDIHHR